jgi:hypothetical protein
VRNERSPSTTLTLVDVAGGVVEDLEHGHDAVAGAVGAADVGVGGADVVDGEADASGELGDARARLERLVDPVDGVVLHGQEEARGELGARGAGVEEGGRGVREEALGHEVVGLDGRVDVLLVDAHRHAHEHLLGPLADLAVHAEQVGALEGLEAEVVEAARGRRRRRSEGGERGVTGRGADARPPHPAPCVDALEVALVVHGGVELVGVLLDDLVDVVGDERRGEAGLGVEVLVELGGVAREALLGLLVQVRHDDARGQDGPVGVVGGGEGGCERRGGERGGGGERERGEGGRESAPPPLRAFDAPVSAASWSSSRVVTPA